MSNADGHPELNPSRNTGLDGNVLIRHRGLLLESGFYLDMIHHYITVVAREKINPVAGIMNSTARSYQNVDAKIYGAEFLASYILTRQLFISTNLSYVRGTRDLVLSEGIRTPNLAEIPPCVRSPDCTTTREDIRPK